LRDAFCFLLFNATHFHRKTPPHWAVMSSTTLNLKAKRKISQTYWLMIAAGERWRLKDMGEMGLIG